MLFTLIHRLNRGWVNYRVFIPLILALTLWRIIGIQFLERIQFLKYAFGMEHLFGMEKLVTLGIEAKKLQSDIAVLI